MKKYWYKDNLNIRKIDGFTLQLVAEDVWAIDEFGIDIMYLILGRERALLFDTGVGLGNVHAVVKEITDLPVYVVNSHHHYDHVGGNCNFSRVYAHKNAISVIRAQNNLSFREQFIMSQAKRQEYNGGASVKASLKQNGQFELEPVEEGRKFCLGERQLEVIFTPGHTKDSICLLDEDNQQLFSADTVVSTPVLMLDSFSDTIESYYHSIIKLSELCGKYDLIFPGHYLRPIGTKYVCEMKECLEVIMSNPGIGQKSECDMTKSKVYLYKHKNASVMYTLDRIKSLQ